MKINDKMLKRVHRMLQTAMLAGIVAFCGTTASLAAGTTTGDERAVDSSFELAEVLDDAWAGEAEEPDLTMLEDDAFEEGGDEPSDDAIFEDGDAGLFDDAVFGDDDWAGDSFEQIARESAEGEETSFEFDDFVPYTVTKNDEMGNKFEGSGENRRCGRSVAAFGCAYDNGSAEKGVSEDEAGDEVDHDGVKDMGEVDQDVATKDEDAASSSDAANGRDGLDSDKVKDNAYEKEAARAPKNCTDSSGGQSEEVRFEKTDLTGFVGGDYAAVMRALGQEGPIAQDACAAITKEVSGVEIKARPSEGGKRYLVTSLKVGSSSAYTLAGIEAAIKFDDVPERLSAQGWRLVADKERKDVQRFVKGQRAIVLKAEGGNWSITLVSIEKPESGKVPDKSE